MTFRVRTQGGFTDGAQKYKTTTFSGTVVESTLNFGCLQVGEFQTTTDVVTPGFRARIARGDIINNYFESVTEKKSNTLSGAKVTRTSGSGSQIKTWEWSQAYADTIAPADYWCDISQGMAEACTEAAARVARPDVDGMVELGEIRETLSLFNRDAWKLRNKLEAEYRKATHYGYSRHVSRFDFVAGEWLRLRYGVMPLVRSMWNILVEGARVVAQRETARGYATMAGDDSGYAGKITGGFWVVESTWQRHWNAAIRAGILYEYERWRSAIGIELDEIPSAAWELTRLSFVVDWFWNVGNYIRAITPHFSTTRLASWRGYLCEVDITLSSTYTWVGGAGYTSSPPSGNVFRRFEARKRVPAVLEPSAYRTVFLNDILNGKSLEDYYPRLADGLALLGQFFIKKVGQR